MYDIVCPSDLVMHCHDFRYVRLGNVELVQVRFGNVEFGDVALGNVELFSSVVCGMSVIELL